MSATPESWSRPAEPAVAAAAIVVAAAVFLLSWTLLHVGFYARDQVVDTPIYEKYGDWMAEGRVPYRDFRPEYPPAALPAFLVPSLVAGEGAPHEEYARVFEWLMAACGLAAIVLMGLALTRLGADPPRTFAALAFAALAPLALGSVVLSRFDLWPAALTVGAVAALAAGRLRLSAGVLGLAVAAKLYPVVLAPLLLAWAWRSRGRREAVVAGAILVGVVAACFVPFLVVAPAGVGESLARQLSRPLQIESLAAAALVAAHHVVGIGLEMDSSHGSQNIAGTTGVVAGIVMTLAQAAALVWVWTTFARHDVNAERFVRFAAAAVLAFVALGKVLSPQFLIWLVPLVPLVAGRRGLWSAALLGLALVLTQLWFPYRYWDYALTFDELASWLVLARDLVLVGALAVLVQEPRRAAEERRDERRPAAFARGVER